MKKAPLAYLFLLIFLISGVVVHAQARAAFGAGSTAAYRQGDIYIHAGATPDRGSILWQGSRLVDLLLVGDTRISLLELPDVPKLEPPAETGGDGDMMGSMSGANAPVPAAAPATGAMGVPAVPTTQAQPSMDAPAPEAAPAMDVPTTQAQPSMDAVQTAEPPVRWKIATGYGQYRIRVDSTEPGLEGLDVVIPGGTFRLAADTDVYLDLRPGIVESLYLVTGTVSWLPSEGSERDFTDQGRLWNRPDGRTWILSPQQGDSWIPPWEIPGMETSGP